MNIGKIRSWKKDKCDLVRCSTTFLVFPWNPILYAMVKKSFLQKNGIDGERLIKSLISFSNFIKLDPFTNFSNFFYQMEP